MANGSHNHEGIPENLRKQLAVAVRSIQWSYAIFWSLSKTRQGVLEWYDGYYNGDIKTRKTVQAMELKADKIGLQRSVQLRELYKSLLEDQTDQQAKRHSAALSPDDLSDAEWYYLVCMSFVFEPGQGLPGRALANGQTIWLSNAQYADSKVFSRSLLAKTVVCFPHLGGVIEIGVTDLVSEDLNLLQRIKASLLDFSKPVCSDISSPAPHRADDDSDPICAKVDQEIPDTLALENLCSPSEDVKFDQHGHPEEFSIDSPDECSNGCEHNHQTEDSYMLEGTNGGGASQVQSWHFMDDDFYTGVQDSMNSSDCISEAFVNQDKAFSSPKHENLEQMHLKELQNSNHTRLNSLDLGTDEDLHYKRTLATILGGPSQLIENPCFRSCDFGFSFTKWKRGGQVNNYRPRIQQSMLKKILFSVPFMYGRCSLKEQKQGVGKAWPSKVQNDCNGHVKYDKLKENERFLLLRTMVPSITEIDKASILNDTIKYLKELEARVEELESYMGSVNYESRARKKYLDIVEQTSDNYKNGKTTWITKRKACDIDETDPDLSRVIHKEGPPDIKVSLKDQEVLIEMRCPYREYILLDIMDAINNLHLDAHSVRSNNHDGVLTLTLKSKFRGAALAPVAMIKQELWKIAGKF
ncbi:hypothetical protein FEM48_Zijuj07G0156100 [Ziziphus jujuba var. spinosa]|uniref:BHLH domain-containing protein n=1 Tax=Ziziphus jujuba var. spinosa TaxID=714518 RepID=A0A978V5H0_ZIZJJ|nr:hypothetical protein FEM48_Zijuj07G0156100 [Ziziphus jujuba var. spinosa]